MEEGTIKSTIEKRMSKLRCELMKKEINGALVSKRENYIYLSGFTGTMAYLLITQNEAILLTDSRYEEQASRQATSYTVVRYKGSLIVEMNEIIKKFNIKKLGFEESFLTFYNYQDYKSKLSVQDFVPLEGIIEAQRIIKDNDELEILKKAVEIADNGFTHILPYLKPGVREIEIAAELEYFMKKLGAKGQSFDMIVASGERSSMPHGVASSKKINLGDVITLDYGAIYNDYCSDMTRTVFLGEPTSEIKKIYNIVLKAQISATEEARAGLSGKIIDNISRQIIEMSGYGDYFGHGLGHGVGLEIHEEPRLAPSGNTIMEDGMVATIEPGIYIPRVGGVRIEDMLIINGDAPIILTKSSKEMIIL